MPRANSLPLSTCWGPLGGAYHQRRQRCRAAPGWRLSRPRPALRPHRRLPRHRARCGPASSRWIFTTISIRPSRPGPPFARCKNRIFRSILAARRKRPSPSPANMPTSSRCGASRWRKPARPSSAYAPKRRNTSVISASASRSGRLSPTAKPKPGESRAYPTRRHRAGGAARGRVQSQTGEHRRPAAAGYRGAGQSGGQTPVDRHRPAGGRRT